MLAGTATLATVASGAVGLLAPDVAHASSHREAPLIAGLPQYDNTDVYAFTSPDKTDTVTLIGDWIPFEEPNGGPNFYKFQPGAHYDIHIDSNGDAKADTTYQWTFTNHYRSKDTFLYNTGVVNDLTDMTLNFYQTYDLVKIDGSGNQTTLLTNARVAPSDVGPASTPDYAKLRSEAVTPIVSGSGATVGHSYAGQADDPFFLDLRIFDLLYGGNFKETGHDTLAGYNVNTIALQVPKSAVALNGNASGNPVIGVWSSTDAQSTRIIGDGSNNKNDLSGNYAQVSRLGNPLVNEAVIPLKDKDNFNNSTPANDSQFASYVTDPIVPKLIQKIYNIPAPPTPRHDLAEIFLTGICKSPTPCQDTTKFPIQADLNSQLLNKDVTSIQPAEELRLNMSVPVTANPNRLGVLGKDLQGFPNGRRLTDDVVDIELKALEGATAPNNADTSMLSDGVDSNDVSFGKSFPYLALPHNDSVNKPGRTPLSFTRLAGADRYGTAAKIAESTFGGSASTVLLASGEKGHYPDALTANYLAGQQNAPILLTRHNKTPSETSAALKSLGAKKIIIIGGKAAVSAGQAKALQGTYTVSRIGGHDRYDTAMKVSETPKASYVKDATAVVATGQNFPDALVGGPLGYHSQYPVEITRQNKLPTATKTALKDLGIKKVLLMGGEKAVSAHVQDQIEALGITVHRLGGHSRTDTAVAVASYELAHGFTHAHVNLARGDLFPDALTGGTHAGVEMAPIVLTKNPSTLSKATTDFLTAHCSTLRSGHVYGGKGAVANSTVSAAEAAGTC
jgi:putative cell wall-binding protein